MANIPIDDMRTAVARKYPGPRWKRKVSDMSDNQIMALYYRFYHSDEEKKEEPKVVETRPKFGAYTGEQMRMEGLS